MKTKIFGFIVLLTLSTLSTQALAGEQIGSPPFSSLTCQANIGKFQIKLQQAEQGSGKGAAIIGALGVKSSGVWNWSAAEEGTRLAGYYYLTVQVSAESDLGPMYIHTLFGPEGELSGGWLMMHRNSAAIECKINNAEQTEHQCKILSQNNCRVSPKRLCCECFYGRLFCS